MSSRSTSCEASVCIPALNEGEQLRLTVESVRETVPPGTEVLVVDDGSADGSADFLRRPGAPARLLEPEVAGARLGAVGARNKAAAHANGRSLVFLDAHVRLPPGWLPPLLDMLDNPAVGAVAPAIAVMGQEASVGYGLRWTDAGFGIEWLPRQGDRPYAVPLLPGACLAMRSAVFLAVGGFDAGLVQWGSEDAELSLRLWRLGYELGLVPQVTVPHLFRERHPYAVAATSIVHNMLRVASVHFTDARIERVHRSMRRHWNYREASDLLAQRGAARQRRDVQAHALRSDEEYFSRFGDIH